MQAGVGPSTAAHAAAAHDAAAHDAAPPPADKRRGRPRRMVWEAAVARPLGLKAQPAEVRVTNLSDTGVGFTSQRPLWPGQAITLTLIGDAAGSRPVLMYQVVYCRPTRYGFVVGAELIRC